MGTISAAQISLFPEFKSAKELLNQAGCHYSIGREWGGEQEIREEFRDGRTGGDHGTGNREGALFFCLKTGFRCTVDIYALISV